VRISSTLFATYPQFSAKEEIPNLEKLKQDVQKALAKYGNRDSNPAYIVLSDILIEWEESATFDEDEDDDDDYLEQTQEVPELVLDSDDDEDFYAANDDKPVKMLLRAPVKPKKAPAERQLHRSGAHVWSNENVNPWTNKAFNPPYNPPFKPYNSGKITFKKY